MNILAIDTSTAFCSITLFYDGHASTLTRYIPRQHNLHLLPMIEELIGNARIDKKSVELVAYGVGPGSFVGVRLSTAVVQALAFALDVPVIGFSSMQAIAMQAYQETQAELVTVILDARMSDIYVGQYAFNEITKVLEIQFEKCMKIIDFNAEMSSKKWGFVVGDEVSELALVVDQNTYCPDTKFLHRMIMSLYLTAKNNNALTQNVMPIYLQGTTQWKKINA